MEYNNKLARPYEVFVGSSDKLRTYTYINSRLNTKYPVKSVKDATQNP